MILSHSQLCNCLLLSLLTFFIPYQMFWPASFENIRIPTSQKLILNLLIKWSFPPVITWNIMKYANWLPIFLLVLTCIYENIHKQICIFMFLSPTNALLYYTYKMLKYTVKISHDCSYMFRSIWTIIREPMPNLAKVTILCRYSVKIRR